MCVCEHVQLCNNGYVYGTPCSNMYHMYAFAREYTKTHMDTHAYSCVYMCEHVTV